MYSTQQDKYYLIDFSVVRFIDDSMQSFLLTLHGTNRLLQLISAQNHEAAGHTWPLKC